MKGVNSTFLFIGVLLILISLMMNVSRLLSCLIVVENLNVLVLLCCLISEWKGLGVMFIILLVIFTIEITLGLVVLSRLWSSSELIDIVGV